MRYWRVIFRKDGSIAGVEPLVRLQGEDWVIVQALNEQAAKRAALSLYAVGKKTLARERLYAAGHCACGRKQDRVNPRRKDGALSKLCRVCAERGKVHQSNHAKRIAEGTVGQGMAERDEAARLGKQASRARDRRAELRLEVLLEVRERWVKLKQLPFGAWLERELATLTATKKR